MLSLLLASGVAFASENDTESVTENGQENGEIELNGVVYVCADGASGIDLSGVSEPTYYDVGEGYALYDPENRSLTLVNATVEGNGISAPFAFKLVLNGESLVTSADATVGNSMGLYANDNLTISGSGSLTVNAGKASAAAASSIAIGVGGSLTVSEETTLTANAGMAPYSIGIQVQNAMTVNGRVYVNGGDAYTDAANCISTSIAVYAKTLTLGENGAVALSTGHADAVFDLYAKMKDEDDNFVALSANDRITIVKNDHSYVWGGDVSKGFQISAYPTVRTYYVADATSRGEVSMTFTVKEAFRIWIPLSMVLALICVSITAAIVLWYRHDTSQREHWADR